jgi:hypothetical protein
MFAPAAPEPFAGIQKLPFQRLLCALEFALSDFRFGSIGALGRLQLYFSSDGDNTPAAMNPTYETGFQPF